jgi:hypothetical protein
VHGPQNYDLVKKYQFFKNNLYSCLLSPFWSIFTHERARTTISFSSPMRDGAPLSGERVDQIAKLNQAGTGRVAICEFSSAG